MLDAQQKRKQERRKQMSEDVLYQPRNFWQWLTGQHGTIYTPPRAFPPKTALDYINMELCSLHQELENYREQLEYRGDDDKGYLRLLDSIDLLNRELVRRSVEESK